MLQRFVNDTGRHKNGTDGYHCCFLHIEKFRRHPLVSPSSSCSMDRTSKIPWTYWRRAWRVFPPPRAKEAWCIMSWRRGTGWLNIRRRQRSTCGILRESKRHGITWTHGNVSFYLVRRCCCYSISLPTSSSQNAARYLWDPLSWQKETKTNLQHEARSHWALKLRVVQSGSHHIFIYKKNP